MRIPEKLLEDDRANQLLVDTLEQLKRERERVTVVESDPTDLTEQPCILYNRSNKELLICDTTEWRRVATT